MSHTLLLADDSTTVQRVVELTFANEDIDVVAVGDGEGAIEAIEREAPDIVLADVGMPGKNGYDVAAFLRSDPARAGIPVVLLTGAFEPLDEERCDAIGSREVLVKPFEPREVVGKVRELLDLPAAGTPGVAPAVAPAAPHVAPVVAAAASDVAPAAVEAAPGQDVAEAAVKAAPDVMEATPARDVAAADASDADLLVAPAEADRTSEVDLPDEAAGEAKAAREAVVPEAPAPAREAVVPEASAPAREAVVPEAPAPAREAVVPEAPAPGETEVPAGDPAGAADDSSEEPSAGETVPAAAAPDPRPGAGGSVLAQSFVTFLAVERGADPPVLAAGAAADAGGAKRPVAVTDAMLDDLARRVVERLTETVLQNAVAEVVSRISERLAREEITRVAPGGE